MQLYEPSRLIFLWMIPFIGGLFLWGNVLRKRRLGELGDPGFLESRLMPGFSISTRRISRLLLILAFFFASLALSRPQWGEEKKRVERKGLDIIFLLDTSLSMLAQDVKPDRLRKAKLEIKSLIWRFKGNRVGMVAFAGTSFLQCPLTLDYSAFMLFVDALKPGYIPTPGTSLARAVELASRGFGEESRKYRAMVMFSDGEDHEGSVEEAVELAKKEGIRIYTVGVGTPEGEPIPLRSESTGAVTGYKKTHEGQVVVTRLNAPLLEQIARETGGLYLPATAAEKEVDIILKHLESLGERKLKERLLVEKEEHFQLFALIAFLFLLAEVAAGERRARFQQAIFPLFAFFIFAGLIDSSQSLVDKGNRNVEKKKYQSAVEEYRKAEVRRPTEPVIRYNLGTALYKLYQYRDAEQELEQALSQAKDPAVKAKILYNYGNTKYRLGDFEKAIDAYKKAVDLDPKDEDAKYNLEFLKKQKSAFEKKQEERQQQKPQQQQNQQKDQNQQQNQQKQEPQQQGEGQEEQQQQSQHQQGPEEQGEGAGQSQQGQQQEDQQQNQGQEQNKGDQQQGEEKGPQGQKEGSEKEREETKEGSGKQQGQEESEQEQPEKTGTQPLQGQMSKESALRLLDALRQGEQRLQDLRRPPVESDSQEPLKDW